MSQMHKSHAYLRESVDRLLREARSRWWLTRYEANVLVGRAIRMEGNRINSLIDLVLASDTAELELLKQQGCTFAKVVRRVPDGRQASACAQSGVAESAGVRATDDARATAGVGRGRSGPGSVCEVPAAAALGTADDRAEAGA